MEGPGVEKPQDRMCPAFTLDNRLRRWLGPPGGDLDLLDIHPGDSVADLGAGVGYYAPEILRRIGAQGQLFLVDLDPENLQIARSRVGADPRVTFIEGAANHVPQIPTGSVDRALLSLVLCCMVDKSGVLRETWRILKPGGRTLVSYPRTLLPFRLSRRNLRVTPDLWSRLLQELPWETRKVPQVLPLRKHLLLKGP